MPKTIRTGNDNQGIDITYIRSHRTLDIGGWYDTMVGIKNESISLGQFLTDLGITLRDCEKALRDYTPEGRNKNVQISG